jgi:thioredoxin 1
MSAHVKPVTEQSFKLEVLQSDRPVLVDFYADWCGPCQTIKPILEELAQEYVGRVDVRRVDVDENQGLAQQYGVRGIPTLLLFKDGQARETVVGLRSKSQLVELIDRAA